MVSPSTKTKPVLHPLSLTLLPCTGVIRPHPFPWWPLIGAGSLFGALKPSFLQPKPLQLPHSLPMGQVLQPSPPWMPFTELPTICLCFCWSRAKTWHSLEISSVKYHAEGWQSCPSIYGTYLCSYNPGAVYHLCCQGTPWVHSQLTVHHYFQTFLMELFPSSLIPSQCHCRLFAYEDPTEIHHLDLLNFMRTCLPIIPASPGQQFHFQVFWLVNPNLESSDKSDESVLFHLFQVVKKIC